MYKWSYNTSSSIPVYKQIADYFKELISNGTLVDGQKLLSQRDYCKFFNVSRPTVNRAFEMLEQEKLISLSPKKKAIVCLSPKEPDNKIEWNQYIKFSQYKSHSDVVKTIASARGNPDIINLHETFFSDEFAPHEPVKKALGIAAREVTGYNHTYLDIRGTLSLRQAICKYVANQGIIAEPSQVVVCNTRQNAYNLIIRALASNGTNIYLTEESTFHNAKHSTPFNFVTIPSDSQGISVDALVQKLEKRGRKRDFLYIDTYHNLPMGITTSPQRRKELVKLSNEWRLPVLEAEHVRDCWHETEPFPSLKSMDTGNGIIYLFALARPFMHSMLTAIIAPEPLIPVFMDLRLQHDAYNDIIAQDLLEMLLTHDIYTEYMDRIRPMIIEKRDAAAKLLNKYFCGIATWNRPSYGVNYRINFDQNISHIFPLLKKDGILLYPPLFFGSEKQFIWFCYTGTTIEQLDYALGKIASLIRKM